MIEILDFWAPWCGPCLRMGPTIEELKFKYRDSDKVKITKVNIDESPELSQEHSVMSIPTLIYIRNGEVIHKSIGQQSVKQITDTLDRLQKEDAV